MARHKEQIQEAADMPEILPERALAIVQAQDAGAVLDVQVTALAERLGYQGHLTVGGLEDEIRFFQRHTVQALLETGKRLLLLKEMTAHGEFLERIELLGFAERSAHRLMSSAAKASKSATVAGLAGKVKSMAVLMELFTHGDDVVESIAAMDKFAVMSLSQVQAAARELEADAIAQVKVLDDKNRRIDKLSRHIAKATPDEVLQELHKEAGNFGLEAAGIVRGSLRQAFIAIRNHGESAEAHDMFLAGLLGQVVADVRLVREEFNLPDVSTVAELQLAREVDQWYVPAADAAKPAKAK